MRARWKLGRLLAEVERGKPGPKAEVAIVLSDSTQSFRALLDRLGIDTRTALEAQRIAAMPEAAAPTWWTTCAGQLQCRSTVHPISGHDTFTAKWFISETSSP